MAKEKKPFEPKTKAGKIVLDALNKVDDEIEEHKEVVNIMLDKLADIASKTPSKVDDAILKAFTVAFSLKYKI